MASCFFFLELEPYAIMMKHIGIRKGSNLSSSRHTYECLGTALTHILIIIIRISLKTHTTTKPFLQTNFTKLEKQKLGSFLLEGGHILCRQTPNIGHGFMDFEIWAFGTKCNNNTSWTTNPQVFAPKLKILYILATENKSHLWP